MGRKISFDPKTKIDQKILSTFKGSERKIIEETLLILNSEEMGYMIMGYEHEVTAKVEIGDRRIIYEEIELPCDGKLFGFSYFEENGFLLFCSAFMNKRELIRTILHELYRLYKSKLNGISGDQEVVSQETHDADNFSLTIYEKIFNK